MKYLLLGISLCMLITAAFAVSFIIDVLKAAWFARKGKDYKWQSFGVFTDNKDWKSILIWGAVVCIGIYGFFWANADLIRSEYEEAEIKCDICGDYFPEKYDTRDSWSTICPYCTNREINEIVRMNVAVCSECGYQYEIAHIKNGMCWDCYLDNSAECTWCGNPAPYELGDGTGEYLCLDCMGEAFGNSKVAKAIWKYLES